MKKDLTLIFMAGLVIFFIPLCVTVAFGSTGYFSQQDEIIHLADPMPRNVATQSQSAETVTTVASKYYPENIVSGSFSVNMDYEQSSKNFQQVFYPDNIVTGTFPLENYISQSVVNNIDTPTLTPTSLANFTINGEVPEQLIYNTVQDSTNQPFVFDRSYFKIYNTTTKQVDYVSIYDYVRGAIAAEMPASYDLEALIAQGVSAVTYGVYHALWQQQYPNAALNGADFSADPLNRRGYMSVEQMETFYGIYSEEYIEKMTLAANVAYNQIIVVDNQPIAAAYHAISAGTTEFAENVWAGSLNGLTSVDSSWDVLATNYQSTATLTQEQLRTTFEKMGVELLPNSNTWFSILERSAAGYVTKVQVGNTTMTGQQLRNALGLRSSYFTIERQGQDFKFMVMGYGHGVGLSQNGANYLAKQGKTHDEILLHYYNGASLVPLVTK